MREKNEREKKNTETIRGMPMLSLVFRLKYRKNERQDYSEISTNLFENVLKPPPSIFLAYSCSFAHSPAHCLFGSILSNNKTWFQRMVVSLLCGFKFQYPNVFDFKRSLKNIGMGMKSVCVCVCVLCIGDATKSK